MYQIVLTRRYLLGKLMPLLACVAVVLCTAMVLITWSVMGGFLEMLIRSGRTMTGDVVVGWDNAGFAHYDELVKRLEADPLVEAAAPMIETFGLVGLPDGRKEMVIVRGVVGESYARVTSYRDVLWWRPLERPTAKDRFAEDPRLKAIGGTTWEQIFQNGIELSRSGPDGVRRPAVVMGIEVSRFNRRTREGFYFPRVRFRATGDGGFEEVDQFLPRDGSVVLNVLPTDSAGRPVETVTRRFPVANEFQSGVFEIDQRVVLLRLDELQRMLRMHEARRERGTGSVAVEVDPSTGEERFTEDAEGAGDEVEPARVTHVLVRGKGDLGQLGAADALWARVRDIYTEFARAHPGEVPEPDVISIMTWEDLNRTMINAVRKETGLVLFIFSFISLTAVFLVLAIFWSMVAEKTKDVGVLRAIGASRSGVAGVWLGYGLAIGLVGSSLGLGLAMVIVRNINEIHDWLGEQLGLVIWDPSVYYFTRIPSAVEPDKALIVFAGGVVSCVLGALAPAIRAARMDPVRALRFE